MTNPALRNLPFILTLSQLRQLASFKLTYQGSSPCTLGSFFALDTGQFAKEKKHRANPRLLFLRNLVRLNRFGRKYHNSSRNQFLSRVRA